MGSMSSLFIGVSGLQSSQSALNTTAHNLTNVDTTGYTRQQILLKDTTYQSLGVGHVSLNQVGIGVNVDLVRQVRDAFLDKAYRLEVGRQGFYEAQYTATEEVENIMGELQGVAFQDSMKDLWNTTQELVKEPDSVVQRTTFIQTAVSFLERAQLVAKQLEDYQVNLNTEIKTTVDKINDIGDKINKLNEQIVFHESSGVENANDLRDTRNNLLDELGNYVKISYAENAEGRVTVNIEGVQFVTEDSVNKMGTEKISESSEMIKPVWPQYGQDVYKENQSYSSNDNTDVGYLKGLMVARGVKKADFTDMPVRKNYASDEEYENAVFNYNTTIDTSIIATTEASFDNLIHGIVTKLNDILCPNKEYTYTDKSGVTKTITILDEETAGVGMGAGNQIAGTELFTRKNCPRYTTETLELSDGSTVTVKRYNEEDLNDTATQYTLSQINVNPDVLENVSLLPLNNKDAPSEYSDKICSQLSDCWKEDFATLGPNVLTKNTFMEYYTALIGDIGTRGNTSNVISTNQESMVASIDNQRNSIAGVSSDEELTKLIKYQHAYNASARYVNVVSEMLEHVISSFFR